MKKSIKTASSDATKTLQVNVKLIGPEVTRFEDYKLKQRLRAGAEAARKLMLERLDEVEQTEPAA